MRQAQWRFITIALATGLIGSGALAARTPGRGSPAAGARRAEDRGRPEEPSTAPATEGRYTRARREIRDLFETYLRLHAAKDMEGWRQLFLPEVDCVRTGGDGVVGKYPIAELAAGIAEDAKTLKEQHETLEDARLEVYGDAASYSATYSLFHDGRKIQQGRAFFTLARIDGAWKIASLVWYKDESPPAPQQ